MTRQTVVVTLAVLMAAWGGGALWPRNATGTPQAAARSSHHAAIEVDEFQRSARIYNFGLFPGDGAERGKELYFFLCSVCHNEFTTKADYAGRAFKAPMLVGIYKRSQLMSGEPVSDQTVWNKILNGGPGMPGYRYMLGAQDRSDLLSYIREGRCCWDEDNPPVNPWYHPTR